MAVNAIGAYESRYAEMNPTPNIDRLREHYDIPEEEVVMVQRDKSK